jgi:hypothetical protein
MTKKEFEKAREQSIRRWKDILYRSETFIECGFCDVFANVSCARCPVNSSGVCGVVPGIDYFDEPDIPMYVLMWLMTDCTWENYGGNNA